MTLFEWLVFNLAEPVTQMVMLAIFILAVAWPASIILPIVAEWLQ